MDRKNIVIFVLGGLAVLFLFLLLVVLDSAKRSQDTAKRLEEEKRTLAVEMEPLRGKQKALNEQISALNGQIEGLDGEKRKLREQLDDAFKERDYLKGDVTRLNGDLSRARSDLQEAQKQLKIAAVAPVVQERPASSPSDSNSNEYWASVLRQKAALEMKLEDLDRRFNEVKLAADKLQREKGEIEQEMTSLVRENQDLMRELEYNKKMVDGFTLDLALEKSNNYEIKNSIGSLREENRDLKRRFKSVSERKEALETSLAELKTRNAELETSLERMQAFVKEKLLQVDALKGEFSSIKTQETASRPSPDVPRQQRSESVNLPPIVVHSEGASPKGVPKNVRKDIRDQVETLEKAAASIIAVNKDDNFVIINQGSNQGIKAGDSFKVFDADNRPAGEIEVIQVRENISAADIRKEIEPLRTGFRVR